MARQELGGAHDAGVDAVRLGGFDEVSHGGYGGGERVAFAGEVAAVQKRSRSAMSYAAARPMSSPR